MSLYEESQTEAINYLTVHNDTIFDMSGTAPDIAEPEDWERYQKQVKSIYSGVRTLRKDKHRQASARQRSPVKENFFIT